MTDRKIIDGFIFFNELSTLNLRLHTLNDYVDYFVIVESGLTHAGNPRPLYYHENRELFSQFESKIIHVVTDENARPVGAIRKMFQHRNAVEYRQRAAILEGASRVPDIRPTDIVMASDADEIPNPEYLKQDTFEDDKLVVFNQRYFFYDFTCENRNGWPGTLAGPYGIFEELNLNQMRKFKYRRKDDRVVYIPSEVSRENHAGWHCSSFGGVDRIITKLESYAHQQYNQPKYKDREKIKDLIRDKKDLILRDDDRHQLFDNDEDTDAHLPKDWKLIYQDL